MKENWFWEVSYTVPALFFGFPILWAATCLLFATDITIGVDVVPSFFRLALPTFLIFVIVPPLGLGYAINRETSLGILRYAPDHPKRFLKRLGRIVLAKYAGYGIAVILYLVTTNPQVISLFNPSATDPTSLAVNFLSIFTMVLTFLLVPIFIAQAQSPDIVRLRLISELDSAPGGSYIDEAFAGFNRLLRKKGSMLRIKQNLSLQVHLYLHEQQKCATIIRLLDAYNTEDPETIVKETARAFREKPESVFEKASLKRPLLRIGGLLVVAIPFAYDLLPIYYPILKFLLHLS